MRKARSTMATRQGYPDVEPDVVSPPGDLLAEELGERGMTQLALAKAMQRSPKVISEIVRGRKAITADTALGLETVLGIPASLWVRLEADYQLHLARERRRSA